MYMSFFFSFLKNITLNYESLFLQNLSPLAIISQRIFFSESLYL